MDITNDKIMADLLKNMQEIKPKDTKILKIKKYEKAIKDARKAGVKWETIHETLKNNGIDISISTIIHHFKKIEENENKLAKEQAKKDKEIDYKALTNEYAILLKHCANFIDKIGNLEVTNKDDIQKELGKSIPLEYFRKIATFI